MCINERSLTSSLRGRRVLVTRAAEQAPDTVALLRQYGAEVLECPTIQLLPPRQWEPVDHAIRRLSEFDWLILTSVNGVRFFLGRMQELGIEFGQLHSCKICAVGSKTGQLLGSYGLEPELIPEQFTGEGIVHAFGAIELRGARILFPKADGARDLIPQKLREFGAIVVDPVVYQNVIPEQLSEAAQIVLQQHTLDAVVFSSPSTVRNFVRLVGNATDLQELLSGVVIASIGPITTQAVREAGLVVAVEPDRSTMESLIAALAAFWDNNT